MKKIEYNSNRNIIHNQLKMARNRVNMSQSELAAKMQVLNVNIDQQMISKIEKNMRIVTDYELACFCRILNVSAKDMLQDL